MEELQRMLGEIDESLRSRYYPFILEDIEYFYDRIRDICTQSNLLSTLLSEINQDSNSIFQLEKEGKEVEITQFEQLVSDVNDKIVSYQQTEAELQNTVTVLYNEVKQAEENCGSDIQNTVIPLCEAEADSILKKQSTTVNLLMAEKDTYERRCQELKSRLSTIQTQNKAKGISSPLVNLDDRESTHKSLLWLYSLKRIVRHSFGIFEVQSDDQTTRIVFDDGKEIIMLTDENNKLNSAKLEMNRVPNDYMNTIQTAFDSILKTAIGNDWSEFVTDFLYYMFSMKRLETEIATIKTRANSMTTIHNNQVRITFRNMINVDLRLPDHYPRTLERIQVEGISHSDIDQSNVYLLKGMLRNKHFFTIVDIVDFIEQSMIDK